MEYAALGRSGLKVSRLCLGTMNFGPYTSEPDAFAIMDDALASGVNFFDTADVYGQDKGKGATETILGRWFAQGGGRREKTVLATKVYGAMGDWPNESRLSALHIRRAAEASLTRLQTDHIDLYQMHHIDRATPWDEIWQAMEILVRDGKVLYVGSSNFAGWHIARAQGAAWRRHFLGLVSEQSIYSLRNRNIELEVIPACESYGIGIIPWAPIAGGLLAGVLEKANVGRRTREPLQKSVERLRPQIEAYESFCRELGRPPAEVALAWTLARHGITAPIVGPRTLAQFRENLAALALKLDDAAMARLDAIWPGPGGPAPEAYAW